MAKKNKYYVVWVGRKKGIYDTWKECQGHVDKYFGAKFMGFKTKEEAETAFKIGFQSYWGKKKKKVLEISEESKRKIGKPILESISVDGAWDTRSGLVEYQGVSTHNLTLLFHQGPYEDGTINIVEFLAIVHALSYCKKHKIDLPIYSDSKIAIGWVKKKKSSTNHSVSDKNKYLFDLIERAEKWLNNNEFPNKILKWETKFWGENPADFGRK
jgi:ribonuclease HI